MFSNNRERRYLFSTLLGGVLLMGNAAVAEEEMVISPTMAFGLQAKVQTVLNEQIEYEVPATLEEHVAQQEFDQMFINSARIVCDKEAMGQALAVQLPAR